MKKIEFIYRNLFALPGLMKGIAAGLYGQGVTLVVQFATVPVLIGAWGVERYGLWLMLMAAPYVLVNLELGVFTVLGNRLATWIKIGDENKSSSLINKVVWTLIGVGLLIFIVSFMFIVLGYFDGYEVYLVAALYAVFILINNFQVVAFRSIAKFHIGSNILSHGRLAEGVGLLVIAPFTDNFLLLLGVHIGLRVFLVFWMVYSFKKNAEWYKVLCFEDSGLSRRDMWGVTNYAAMPVALMLNNNLLVLILGAKFGPATVAIYVTCRTYYRLVLQLVSVVAKASYQQINQFNHDGSTERNRSLLVSLTCTTILILLCSAPIMMYSSTIVFEVWARGKVDLSMSGEMAILVSVFMFALWHPFFIFLSAVENYGVHLKLYLMLSAFSILFVLYGLKEFESILWLLAIVEVVAVLMFAVVAFKRAQTGSR